MLSTAAFSFIEQDGPYGNGTPLLCGTNGVDEPCVFAFADDVVFGENAVAGMVALFERTGNPVLAVQEVPEDEVRKFGILDTVLANGTDVVRRFIEKPGPGETTSRLASLGRYLVTPELVNVLRSTPTGKGGELWLADAFIQLLNAGRTLNVYRLTSGEWHTVGTPEGYARAAVAAMNFECFAPSVRA
jgi:UTP--glucose-1-phosphate uridylyltransferase